MSDLVFPLLDGLDINVIKTPIFKTALFDPVSGKESRIGLMQSPKFSFKLSFNFLTQDTDYPDYQALFAFMMQHRGMLESFLFEDLSDHQAINQVVATGNGTATQFRLKRVLNGVVTDLLYFIKEVSKVTLDGVEVINPDDYSYTTGGLLNFTVAPPTGAVIRWDGLFYHRCRFNQEGYDLSKLCLDLYESRDIELIGALWEAV